MKKSPVAALIITAGKTRHSDGFEPMMKVGQVSAVRRLIQTFEQAGANPVAVVADQGAARLRRHISRYGVICLEDTDGSAREMIDFAKIGLRYLETRCEKVLLTPVDIPLFAVPTVTALIRSEAELASPVVNGRRGHPLLISSAVIPGILRYEGDNGLRGAFEKLNLKRELIEVDDAGVLTDVESVTDYQDLLNARSRRIHSETRVALAREDTFFDGSTARLLLLIGDTGSVRMACGRMGISYSKAWSLIGNMEEELGVRLVVRRQGGKNGGSAELTQEASEILDRFCRYESACKSAAEKLFREYFGNI